ncbi:FHA domain-containing protein At4g14490-like [Prosopis cineraria]|uniref:FHA domain-containing protein At4g14490-like n=1 Tax=Prosopis cineraria TaxID=364024 RepID=UPI00240F9C83|nr:FHA domain-containing protein At4g14490-like [Prosopis cineraria]
MSECVAAANTQTPTLEFSNPLNSLSERKMEPRHLKLIILQGPREGETLGFEPGKAVRIGRIVRNNTFSIKDAGISSNHLSILVESAKWVLRDLDSSNGTFLNGSKIPPNSPFDLCHGDTIKIGELTSIQVDLQAREGSCLRRNPRRQAAAKASGTGREKLEQEDEKSEGKSSETVVVEPVEKKRGRPRRGRGLKGEIEEDFSKVQLQSIDENVEVGDELKNVVPLQEKVEAPVNKRVTRTSKKQQQQQNVIGTSNSSVVTNTLDNSGLECTEEKIVEKKTRRVGTRRRKLQEEPSLCDQVDISEDMVQEARDTEANLNPGGKEGFEEHESKNYCCSIKEACSSKREGEEACSSQGKNSNENGDWPDLEKLTLGEWFHFLEVHLPKQIIDATEEMIDSMKEKAERVRDYMVKQRNDKATLPVG